ncbi:phosphoribosyl transferase [Flavobacteriaceae bacterium R38]|nr:phosphoribosyl transferase [Flavobacteriaceae bacterium R38]
MNYRSISDLNDIILKKLYLIPRDIDLIVGVPRSGMMPANLLALYLNLPYTDIHSFIKGYIYKSGARRQFFDSSDYKKILVVDDSIASGSALRECKENLKHLTSKFDFKYFVVYATPENADAVDYALEKVTTPRYFQWNIFNHTTLEKACFDIDGVLCVDPTAEENDDGEKYTSFLLNAAPLYIPGSKIGTLVTSRLEKYRKETETWLHANGVKYDKLIMLDLPNAKARQKANCHGSHKANEYKSKKYNLFVESELGQAIEINRLTKKPVFCTANFKMIYESESFAYNIKSGKYLPFLRKAGLKLRNVIRRFNGKKVAKSKVSVSPN